MPTCSSRPDASHDMQHDFLGLSTLKVDHSRSTRICVDSSQRDKHSGTHIIAVHFEIKNDSSENIKNTHFWVTSGA